MAELHGRILRFSNRQGLAARRRFRVFLGLAVLALAVSFAAPARADDGPQIDDLLSAAEDLRADEASARERAVHYLSTLPESALPAIAERLRQTRRQIIPEEDGYDALRFFRHATGSLRADDMIDIVPGILPVLAERRTAVVGRTAERLLYMRSLEAIGTTEAQVMIGDILALTSRMWRWERRRLVERHGVDLLPGLLLLRNHAESPVRVWARWAIEELGMDKPAEALQQEDPMLVARILRAYGQSRDMDSMEVVISYVGHPAAPIREAARAAMAEFAHNGIWQLRKAMRNQLGQDANHDWGWERTARELYEGLDAARLAPLEAVLDEGLAAAESGDVATATEKLGEVLRAAPMHPRRPAIAEAYLALAEAEPDAAERFIRRAHLLAPTDSAVRAAVLALEAEADLGRGVLDADAWREAARQGHPRARAVVEDLLDEEVAELPGAQPGVAESEGTMGWVWLALVALLALALVFRFRQKLRTAGGSLARRAASYRRRPHMAASAERGREPEPAIEAEAEEPSPWREKLTALTTPILERAHRGLTSTGLLRRLALFRRLIQGKPPTPPPRPKVRAKDVVRQRYSKKPEAPAPKKTAPRPSVPKPKPRVVDATRPKAAKAEPAETTGLDALLLGGAPARPVEPDQTFRSPPPAMESRAQAPDLGALVLGGANEERAERSSPGTIEAPDLDAGDTLAEPAPIHGDPNDTLRE